MRLPEAKAMELAEQKRPGCAVQLRWLIKIDDGDARPGAERWQEIEEKAIRLGNLMVHMHHEDKVHGTERQPRIVRFAEHKGYIVQMLPANPFLKFRTNRQAPRPRPERAQPALHASLAGPYNSLRRPLGRQPSCRDLRRENS